ncbi:MAG: ABC transporter permease [Candidatus Rokuibacteriota bacterium]|nr:MAG: ABC transporter permease [Candidatus Rokubacteria bacterium]
MATELGVHTVKPSAWMDRARWLLKRYWVTMVSLIAVLGLWELVTQARLVPRFLLPSPSSILAAGIQFREVLVADAGVTTGEILLGFVAGSLVGLLLAIGIVFSRMIEQIVYPPAIITQVVPKLAVAPLFVVWFGVGVTPKVMITLLICLFPVLVNAVVGMRAVDPRMLDLMHSVDAGRWQIFTKVEFPNATPHVFAGLKVGITLAVVGAIVGEWLGSNIGLGYRILAADSALRTDLLFAAILVLSVVGVALFGLVALAERLVIRGAQPIDGAAAKGNL